jgi:hypothetical protein
MPEKEKKVKVPKPGSKKAILLKAQQSTEFALPTIYIFDSTLFMEFKNSTDLKKSFLNVHNFYEKQALKGPLKGANMPTTIYLDWRETHFEFAEEEQLLHNIIPFELNFDYIIAYIQNDKSTLLHEWAHSVYFKNSEYRDHVHTCYSALDIKTRQIIEKELKMRNYQEDVYEDEFQAYIREDPSDFGKKCTSLLSGIHTSFKLYVKIPEHNNLMQVYPIQEIQ